MQCLLVCHLDSTAEGVHIHFAKYIKAMMDYRPIDSEIYFPPRSNVNYSSQSNADQWMLLEEILMKEDKMQ